MTRLLTDEQLAELSRPPRAKVEALLRAGDADGARVVLKRYETSLRAQTDRYLQWVEGIAEYVVTEHGATALTALLGAVRAFIAVSPDVAGLGAADPESMIDAVLGAADPDAALEVFDAVEAAWVPTVDFHRDWISAELSHVYRVFGPDELEAVLRFCGGRTLVAGLTADIARDPVDRIRRFVTLLQGHFTDLTVTEDDDRFVIEQHLCGTCTRQTRDGRYGPPMSLAVIDDAHPVAWGGRPTTIYRSHIPIWHVQMPIEQIGLPWPVNQCPRGTDDGACTILIYKDPMNPAATAEIPTP
jgi:hypothetical protein